MATAVTLIWRKDDAGEDIQCVRLLIPNKSLGSPNLFFKSLVPVFNNTSRSTPPVPSLWNPISFEIVLDMMPAVPDITQRKHTGVHRWPAGLWPLSHPTHSMFNDADARRAPSTAASRWRQQQTRPPTSKYGLLTVSRCYVPRSEREDWMMTSCP